jgi:putative ABC transport system substrate-binding protein
MTVPVATLRADPSRTTIAPTMNRRAFITGLGAMLAAPLAARAQQPSKSFRVGILAHATPDVASASLAVFRQSLAGLGWIEGRNLSIDLRLADRQDRLTREAADLVQSGVHVIVTVATPAALAAKQATTTIPIVMVSALDPIQSGIVSSLARPEGNITGNATQTTDLTTKQMQILKELVPPLARLGIAWNPSNPAFSDATWSELLSAARVLSLELRRFDVRNVEELTQISAEMVRALLIMADPAFHVGLPKIADFALRRKLPTAYLFREFVSVGGLASYGPNLADLVSRSALYVDKILRGAKPSSLPIEQPIKFDFAVNMKTAKALGLTIPPSLLLRADQVIE